MTDTAAFGEEGIPDDYDGEQDETEDDEIHETDLAALLGNSGEDPEADALGEALQLDAVAVVAYGKGKGKGKGKIKGKGKGKCKGNNLFDLALTGDEMSFDATALVAHARLDASDVPVETPPKAPPSARRPRKRPRVVPSPPPPAPQCAGGCKENSRRGTNATVERFTCVDCGFVTTRSKGATEDPAMLPRLWCVCVLEGHTRVASQ